MQFNSKLRIAIFNLLIYLIFCLLLKTTIFIQEIDSKLFHYFQLQRTSFGDVCMTFITYFGNSTYLLIPVFIACIIFVVYKNWKYLALTVISFGGIELLVGCSKLIMLRGCPFALLKGPNQFLSFPSGHSALSAAFYGLIIYFSEKHFVKTQPKIIIITSGTLLILAISFSRLYLSAHWFFDILAGLALGFGWLFLVLGVYEKIVVTKYKPKVFRRRNKNG